METLGSLNDLLYGKFQKDRIVSCGIKDNSVELFLQLEDGTIVSEFKPLRYWLCSYIPLDPYFTRLEGNLYYKWIKKYESKQDYIVDLKGFWKEDTSRVYDDKQAAQTLYGFTMFKGMKLEEISVLSFDIETDGLVKNQNSTVYLISSTYRDIHGEETRLWDFKDYKTPGDMILNWCEWVREKNPSIMLGHNILSYDLPYMEHVASLHNCYLDLGRDGSRMVINKYESKFRKDGNEDFKYYDVEVYGRELVDTFFLSYKYDVGRKYVSNGLKQIIKQEGLEDPNRTFYDAGQIRNKYNDPVEWEKIKLYAIDDAKDALKLFYLMIPSFFYMTRNLTCSLQATINKASGSQLNGILVRSYLQHGHSFPKANKAVAFEGAISFGIPGVYRNVLKADCIAMYPSIIRQHRIYDEAKDPYGHFYAMVDSFTIKRFEEKRLAKETGDKYYRDLEQSSKIFINSCYGLLGATGLHFNAPPLAALVTKYGREIISSVVKWSTSNGVEHYNEYRKLDVEKL